MGNFVILSILWRRDRVASENHNKKPLVIERRRGKERKKTPRLTKTYEVKIIPATIGVVMETEEPPKKRVAAYCRVSTDQEAQETSLEEQIGSGTQLCAVHQNLCQCKDQADCDSAMLRERPECNQVQQWGKQAELCHQHKGSSNPAGVSETVTLWKCGGWKAYLYFESASLLYWQWVKCTLCPQTAGCRPYWMSFRRIWYWQQAFWP